MSNDTGLKPFKLNFPMKLFLMVKAQADAEHRSVSGQIRTILEFWFKHDPQRMALENDLLRAKIERLEKDV